MSADPDTFIDAIGNRHYPAENDCRIVSLVPSLTELLFDLGLGEYMVGRTGFCIHPRDQVKGVPKVGGTKDVKVNELLKLKPTHLLVNIDENRRDIVEKMAESVPHIIVTHPCTPEDNIDLYRLIGGIFGKETPAEDLASGLRQELNRLQEMRNELPQYRVLYLIWREPWMTISRDTYISGMLSLINWITVNPETNERYPVIENFEEIAGESDLVLLSSEPYRFREQHVRECRELALGAGVMQVDGELLSWYGSRAVQGLRYLGELAKNNMRETNADNVSVH